MHEVLANTDMIKKMLEHGIVPRLPAVSLDGDILASHPDFVPCEGDMNDIVSVEYDCDEEVQCIAIDDEDHLYLTDGYIPTHNTSNIVFLKSTDDAMIETLSKMSGTKHVARIDSKTMTKDNQAMLKMTQTEGKTSYTMTTKEEPVISYNDMAFISERNSIVFRAGDSPIWNRNETILPMSWRLFKNTIIQPGKEYTLMTIPTLSTAMDFDVRKNQPNFAKMLEKRMAQANIAKDAEASYKDAYGYTDYDVEQLDPDTYADEIMDIICSTLNPEELKLAMATQGDSKKDIDSEEYEEIIEYMFGNRDSKKFDVKSEVFDELGELEENKEVTSAANEAMQKQKVAALLRYAGKKISRDMLVSNMGISHGLDDTIIRVYKKIRAKMEKDSEYFTVVGGNLCGLNGTVYIKNNTNNDNIAQLNDMSKDETKRVFSDGDIDKSDMDAISSYSVTDAFYKFLVTFPKAWPFADGEFEQRMSQEMSDNDA